MHLKAKDEASWFKPSFLQVLDDHLEYLKTAGKVMQTHITDGKNFKNEGDFYGLLKDIEIPIPEKHFYIVMRINGLTSSYDYDGEKSVLLIPDFEEIEMLMERHSTQ